MIEPTFIHRTDMMNHIALFLSLEDYVVINGKEIEYYTPYESIRIIDLLNLADFNINGYCGCREISDEEEWSNYESPNDIDPIELYRVLKSILSKNEEEILFELVMANLR